MLSTLKNLTTLDAVHEYAERQYPFLASGSTRDVFVFSDECVLKIPHDASCLKYNKSEIKYFVKNLHCREYLAEITEWSPNFYWLLMKRGCLGEFTHRELEKLREKCKGIDDIWSFNVATFGGKPRLIDYGYNPCLWRN